MEGGEYRFELCSDAETVVLEQAVILEGEHNAPYPEDVFEGVSRRQLGRAHG